MFAKSSIQAKLEEEIIASLDQLAQLQKDSAEYGVAVDRLSKLHKLKSEEQTEMPSMNTVLVVGANIFGILWLTRYEKEHVLSSKALGFVMKPR